MRRWMTCAAGTLACWMAGTGQAGLVLDSQFNTAGDTESWVSQQIAGLTADGSSLTGTISGVDPKFLYNPDLSLSPGQTWDEMELRVRVTDPTNGPLVLTASSFNLYRLDATFGPAPVVIDTGDGFYTMTFDISYFNGVPQGSDGVLGLTRLDVVGGAPFNGDTIEVDYIQITEVPEPASAALIALGGLAMLRRRR